MFTVCAMNISFFSLVRSFNGNRIKSPRKKSPWKKSPWKKSLWIYTVEREPVQTRVLNPNASKASYKPKQRSYRKTKLKKNLAPDSSGAQMSGAQISSAQTAASNQRCPTRKMPPGCQPRKMPPFSNFSCPIPTTSFTENI